MENLSKYLPTAEMLEDFKKFKSMTPEERTVFQEERARK